MISSLLKKVFGSRNDRLVKQYRQTVARINALESGLTGLSDEALGAKTAEFRQRLANGETLEQLLPEAFAVCREASRRALGMRHFDVQLIGGMVLNDGKIAEMRTGEGKTLVATLPAYLNALTGDGVHIVTVNDYLASRDAALMAPLYEFLGLSVGVNLSQMSHEAKQAAYGADITYGTNNEFGFDYLRDNMVFSLAEKVQRKLAFAVVDEVDSILIDEARTPLLISGPADDNVEMYQRMNGVPAMLARQTEEEGSGDYWVDEKAHTVMLSEAGHERAEAILTELGLLAEGDSLYSATNITLMHHLMAALRAHALYHRDQHYVVQNDEVVIVDEFTGRLMSGRRWSEGLHGKTLARLLGQVERVLVPVQPSFFDILATRHFLDALLAEKAVRKARTFVAVVGMRVDARTRAAGELARFLAAYDIPVLSCLRDTQLYVQLAANGMTLFDLSAARAARDLAQWQPIIDWVDGPA